MKPNLGTGVGVGKFFSVKGQIEIFQALWTIWLLSQFLNSVIVESEDICQQMVWLCSNKILFTGTGGRWDSLPTPAQESSPKASYRTEFNNPFRQCPPYLTHFIVIQTLSVMILQS